MKRSAEKILATAALLSLTSIGFAGNIEFLAQGSSIDNKTSTYTFAQEALSKYSSEGIKLDNITFDNLSSFDGGSSNPKKLLFTLSGGVFKSVGYKVYNKNTGTQANDCELKSSATLECVIPSNIDNVSIYSSSDNITILPSGDVSMSVTARTIEGVVEFTKATKPNYLVLEKKKWVSIGFDKDKIEKKIDVNAQRKKFTDGTDNASVKLMVVFDSNLNFKPIDKKYTLKLEADAGTGFYYMNDNDNYTSNGSKYVYSFEEKNLGTPVGNDNVTMLKSLSAMKPGKFNLKAVVTTNDSGISITPDNSTSFELSINGAVYKIPVLSNNSSSYLVFANHSDQSAEVTATIYNRDGVEVCSYQLTDDKGRQEIPAGGTSFYYGSTIYNNCVSSQKTPVYSMEVIVAAPSNKVTGSAQLGGTTVRTIPVYKLNDDISDYIQ